MHLLLVNLSRDFGGNILGRTCCQKKIEKGEKNNIVWKDRFSRTEQHVNSKGCDEFLPNICNSMPRYLDIKWGHSSWQSLGQTQQLGYARLDRFLHKRPDAQRHVEMIYLQQPSHY